MRKHLSFLTIIFASSIALAEGSQNTNTTASASQPNATQDIDANAETFAHIEKLDQTIEETDKEVKAMKAHQELQALRMTKEKSGPGFTILRIEGFNNKLYAVFMMPNQSIERAAVGEVIDEIYKVTKITPNSVLVEDTKHHESYSTPFFTQSGKKNNGK